MLRQALEAKGIHLSDSEFAIVTEITTDDIKFNNIHFGKKTSKADIIAIAERTIKVLRRC